MENNKNCIIIDGKQHNFVAEPQEQRELCSICSLKEACFDKLNADNMICRLYFNDKVKNGSFQLKK